MKNIMSFEEFAIYLESKDSENERKELENYFNKEKEEKRILTFEEWSSSGYERYVFLTYDLQEIKHYPNIYTPINNYLEKGLGFSRQLYNKQLTNNSFVAFINPINGNTLQSIGNQLVNFFGNHLPNFRIYMNITDNKEYFLHP